MYLENLILTLLICAVWAYPAPTAAEESIHDSSIRFLEQRLSEDPDDFLAHAHLSTAYLKKSSSSGDLALITKAKTRAESSIQLAFGKDRIPGFLALGQANLQLHHFREALESASDVLAISPKSPPALELTFDALIELGQLDKAAETLKKIKAQGVQGVPLWARESRLAELKGQYEKAIERLSEAAKKDQNLLIRYGEICFRYGRLKVARTAFEEALAYGNQWAALEHLAEVQAAEAQWDLALTNLTAAIKLAPERPELYQTMGDIYVFRGDVKSAAPFFQEAKRLYENSIAAGNDHFLHHLSGFYADSLPDAQLAHQFAKMDLLLRQGAYANDTLAWALFKKGQTEMAKSTIGKALSTGLQDPHVLYHAGMIYSLSGNFQEGQNLLRRAESINPYFMAFHTHR